MHGRLPPRPHGRDPLTVGKPCGKCGKLLPESGPDPCLGMLPGVRFACCGHGKERGYIMFANGLTVRFQLEKVDTSAHVPGSYLVCEAP